MTDEFDRASDYEQLEREVSIARVLASLPKPAAPRACAHCEEFLRAPMSVNCARCDEELSNEA